MSASLRSRRVGSRRGADVLFGHHDAHRSAIRVDYLAVADLVLLPAEGMDTKGSAVDAPFAAPRPSRPRRSGCWSSDPIPGTRCRLPCGSGCVRHRTRRDIPPAATGRRTARRQRRCRPARNPSPHVRDRSAPPARRPSRPGCARCGSATARARSCAGWESR